MSVNSIGTHVSSDGKIRFLQQAYLNNWQQYLKLLSPDAARGWDLCVLTASDERQAEMYRRQLALRRDGGMLPSQTRFLVVPDPAGKRIGSGGATLRVLAALEMGHYEDVCPSGGQGQRVLLIHSGGDSRRVPHCSATGKLFAHVPRALPNGAGSTLFDELLICLSGVSLELPPGVLVASGDVLLVFDHLQLSFQRPGVIGVAIAAPAEVGTRHGVYVNDVRHMQSPRLRRYLHKPSLERLRQWDAISASGTIDIDTGLVWFDARAVHDLTALAGEETISTLCGLSSQGDEETPGNDGPAGSLSLYGDLLMPLVKTTVLEDYMANTSDGPSTPPVRTARTTIWERMRGTPFTVERLDPAEFVHFGTSLEYWRIVTAAPEWVRALGWSSHTASWFSETSGTGKEQSYSVRSVVTGNIRPAEDPVLLFDAQIDGSLSCAGAALIAGLRSDREIALEADVVVHQLPLADGFFVTRIFGLYDDPKQLWDDPGATIVNRPWETWLQEIEIPPEMIWPHVSPNERTLWNARLYPAVADRDDSLALALVVQSPATAPPEQKQRWQDSHRLSLAEGFALADGERLLAAGEAIADEVAVRQFLEAVEVERPATQIRSTLGTNVPSVDKRVSRVAELLSARDPVIQLRGYKALTEASGDDKWEDRAFAILAELIENDVQERHSLSRGAGVSERPSPPGQEARQVVRVEAAARIDFGGGWTDTPPYSIERGGTVLNAAVTLHGVHPIVVEAAWLTEPRLVLRSDDIDAEICPTCLGEVQGYDNPADPFALLKGTLALRGIVPLDADPALALSDVLPGGRGLHLCTRTSIPRGSGLGTSSILAGAVLSCLARLQGSELAQAQLFDEVLCLEQMLTTGGGWQDQVGGLTGGIKLVTTEPGLPQQIEVTPVALSDETREALCQRLLLVYTGQRRLAKNLLRGVMRRWMARDPEMAWIQDEIARLALEMRDALQADEVSSFGELLGEHWQLNKRIDPGCTNPFIDRLFEVMGPFICGGKLAGAGGGGFAFVVARDDGAARDLERALRDHYPGTMVALWPCIVADQGTVTSIT
jgi:fucokinase